MELFYQPDILSGIHYLDEEESRHCVKSLRHGNGDVIFIADGRGTLFKARITVANAKKCEFKIVSHDRHAEKYYSIHIALAPTKNIDRTEWFIEKSVEIGIERISFYFTNRSERKKIKMDRMRRKAISAMKQSGHFNLPMIHQWKDLESFLNQLPDGCLKGIAHVDPKNPIQLKDFATRHQTYVVLIGPEGDFTPEELKLAEDHGFTRVSLGPYRLRTETAALVACHTLNLINQ